MGCVCTLRVACVAGPKLVVAPRPAGELSRREPACLEEDTGDGNGEAL